jgi:hypothetical protein
MQSRERSQETSQQRSREVQPSEAVDNEPIVGETHEKEGSTALN